MKKENIPVEDELAKDEISSEDCSYNQVNNLLKDAWNKLEIAANRPEGISGLQSGFHQLDKITSGWQEGELIVISGRPSMGKTSFILSLVCNMSSDYKYPVGVISLEQTESQLTNRLIVNRCEIPSEKIKNGQLAPFEWEVLDHKIKELYNAPIYIDCPSRISIQGLCLKARKMVKEDGVKIIFIDYVQLLSVTNKYTENRYNEMNYISRELKALVKELSIPLIVVSQMNRNIENDKSRIGAEGKRPVLTDLRDSGTLCDDADIVCFIHRPEYYKIYEDEKGNSLFGLAEIIIAKHRNGATGDITLRFKNELCKFQNLGDDPYTTKPKIDFPSSCNKDTSNLPF